MFQYQRLYNLLFYIYNNDHVLPAHLAEHLNVSVRTIRSDVIVANDTLIKNGAEIILKRNHGYYLKINNDEQFQKFLNSSRIQLSRIMDLETTESRINYLTKLLLLNNDYLSFEYLEQELCVTSATLQNYIKTIENHIETYELEIISRSNSGIKILGDEKMKRKFITQNYFNNHNNEYISKFSNQEISFFAEINLDYLKETLFHFFNDENIAISDMNLKNLTIHISLMILRLSSGNYINFFRHIDINPKYEQILYHIIHYLEDTYHIYISENEKQYLYIHIVSNTNINVSEISNKQVYFYVEQLLECIYEDYNFDLRSDTLLVEDLMNHFITILSSKLIYAEKRNPLLNTIKSNFPLPFEIAFTSIKKVFKHTEYDLDENDAGYISLHIGAAIERCFNTRYIAKNVLLVCDGSHAIARVLEARLENYFAKKINILGIISYSEILDLQKKEFENIDFVITTTPLDLKYCPSIIVDFALKNKDIEAISKMLNVINKNKSNEKNHFFNKQLFINDKLYDNKIDLLSDMTDLLLENHIIEENFLDSVLEREKLAKTNINEIFAFPHPLKFYANETKVVVALLKKPLKWNGNETVQIVFLLATKANETKDLNMLYNIIVEIINNAALQKKILKSNNFEDFINLLPNTI